MAEITPLGVKVEGTPTDVRASAVVPGTREVLENIYNDFLDAKQKGELALDATFDGWIASSLKMLKGHRMQEIKDQYSIGQIGRAEYEALEEFRVKLITVLERAEPRFWGFDNYGIQYVQVENRHLYKEKVAQSEMVSAQHRDVKIKTTNGNGILRG